MVYRVLSIDGGGVRGIIPAMFLAEIERCTGKAISDLFDLIAGTSTGGILALGFALADETGKPKFSAADGVRIYAENSDDVFPPQYGIFSAIKNALFDEKYNHEGLKRTLQQYLGDAQLDDVLPHVDVIIPSYDLTERKPRFFKSSRLEDRHYFMWQIGLATTAAPTYFEPYHATQPPLSDEILVDGGLFANNPAMCAYAEAKFHNHDDILLVSIGTGYATEALPFESVKDRGQIQWILPLINIIFDGMGGAVDFQLRQILPDERYYRFQIKLPNDVAILDNATAQNITALKDYANQMIMRAKDDGSFDQLCGLLSP